MKTKLFKKHDRYMQQKLRLQRFRDKEEREKVHQQYLRDERKRIMEERRKRRNLGWKIERLTPDTSPKTPHDFAAISYIAMELNYESVAQATGLTYVRVDELAHNKKAQRMIHENAELFKQSLQERIAQFAPVAEKFLEDLITGKIEYASTALRAKYANLALARAGFGEIRNVSITHAQLSREDIEQIKARALKAAQEQGLFIDGDFTELK